MPIRKIEAIEAECDGCGKIQIATDETLVFGFSGTARQTYETGGSSLVTFFACKAPCIAKAITNVLEEDKNR